MSSPSSKDLQRIAYWQHYKYYEGHLDIRVSRSCYEKRWVVLLGNEIHLYTSKIPQRDQGFIQPIQHYPIHPSITITLDHDFKLHIKCDLWTIRAQATSNEERENWRIRILTIAMGDVPDQERLLPGQQGLLQEILQKEQARKHNNGRLLKARRGSSPGNLQFSPPTNVGRRGRSFNEASHAYSDNNYYKFFPEDMANSQLLPPIWFFGKISRNKAEEILHQSVSNGDLLLRESEAHPGQYTLSVRQDTDNMSLIRHYMFRKDPYGSGFLLLIDNKPPILGSMYELMWYFIEQSGGHLLPIQSDPNLPPPNYDVSVQGMLVKDPSTGELTALQKRSSYGKSHSAEEVPSPRIPRRSAALPKEPEDDYLVPDVLPSPRRGSSKSPLVSVSESFDASVDTYSPAKQREEELPVREAPLPPPHALHAASQSRLELPSPTGDANTTGYVKMRSFSSTPSLPSSARHQSESSSSLSSSQDDVGYMNMKKQSSLDEASIRSSRSNNDDAGGGQISGPSPNPPPLPRKSRSHHGYSTNLKSVPEDAAETGIPSPVVRHLKRSSRHSESNA